MPTRSSKSKLDLNENAFRILQEATGQAPKTLPPSMRVDSKKNPAAVALGKLGGKKGGLARAASLTARKRSEIAKKAATARWKSSNQSP
jgi:hypothetical protein